VHERVADRVQVQTWLGVDVADAVADVLADGIVAAPLAWATAEVAPRTESVAVSTVRNRRPAYMG
jgi:hypothetical protein